ncbi:hypothetical protein M2306_001076 [Myroides gitamensis]|uniref:hypothetical protein n=1 Tax=Myroides odoratus TaxID=256 RepID=UPI00216946D5|nr:hypothetical protein [Myroides odoratus]MCS4238684.1 hypothetical protein [Myroides odoratus]MDH6600382.1 hypothetical protein [Myroides gitamensis]
MITIESLIGILKLGLENLNALNKKNKNINVRDILVINEDTLCCNFYPDAEKSMDVKLEIATIMSFFNGFFSNDGYEGICFSHYTVRAFDKNNVEVIYAISSKTTAALIANGNSIDWLKSTLFQENTSDYRLSQAKTIISEIENCLRELIKVKLNAKYGENWWDISLDNKLGKSVKDTYSNQFGVECNDGDILILYTFTLQLKKIITANFNMFKTYFDDLSSFNNQMDNLNLIRREEAHNREITESHLIQLNNLHERLLSKVLVELTGFQSIYLTENWKLKIKKIFIEKPFKSIYSEQDVLNEENLISKIQKSKKNTEHLISYLNETIIKLKSISAPIHKKTTHRDLVKNLAVFRELQDELLLAHSKFDKDNLNSIVIRINTHKKVMDDFVYNYLLNES